jgi:hypothetical protein
MTSTVTSTVMTPTVTSTVMTPTKTMSLEELPLLLEPFVSQIEMTFTCFVASTPQPLYPAISADLFITTAQTLFSNPRINVRHQVRIEPHLSFSIALSSNSSIETQILKTIVTE